ncbi:MAG: DUF1579 family protein [Planctomycetota bacterium]
MAFRSRKQIRLLIFLLMVGAAYCVLFVASDGLRAQGFPEPKPTEDHNVFAQNKGTWLHEIKMYLSGPNGSPTKFQGKEEVKLVSGGLYQQIDFRMEMPNREFEGHFLSGYNPKAKQYQGTWVDNFTHAPCRLTGKYDGQEKQLILLGTVQDLRGNELQQKQVTTWMDEKTKSFEIFHVFQQGDKEISVLLMESKATKQ